MKPTINRKPLMTALIVAALSIPGCMKGGGITPRTLGKGGGLGPAPVPASDGAPQVAGQPQISQLSMGVGGRDFAQINQTMASLTGIDPRNATALKTYNAVTASLPNDNNLTTIAGPNIVAVTRLASQYCDLVVANNNANRAALFPGVNFAQGTGSIAPAVRDGVISALLTRFNCDATAAPDDLATLQQLYTDLVTASASTTGVMVSLCTAALGSVKAVVAL